MKNTKGFLLLELMVAVALITAIALIFGIMHMHTQRYHQQAKIYLEIASMAEELIRTPSMCKEGYRIDRILLSRYSSAHYQQVKIIVTPEIPESKPITLIGGILCHD